MGRSFTMGLLSLALVVSVAGCGRTQDASLQSANTQVVRVTGAWARSSPAMATMGAAYLTLTSAGDDRLLEVQVPAFVAARAEMHEVRKDSHGQMTMRRVEGIALPANQQVTLGPGSSHIMLVDLSRPLVAGDTLDVVLKFEKATRMAVRVPVRDP